MNEKEETIIKFLLEQTVLAVSDNSSLLRSQSLHSYPTIIARHHVLENSRVNRVDHVGGRIMNNIALNTRRSFSREFRISIVFDRSIPDGEK